MIDDHWTVLRSLSTEKLSFLRSATMELQRVSDMWGSRDRIHKYQQLGLLTTVQVYSLSRRTIQQLALMSRVVTNSTFSFALVFSLSSGSGNALPTLSTALPFLQQRLSTRIVPSVLREQVALVFSQFLSKQQGITACSYQTPRYLAMSTQGTVLGGSSCGADESGSRINPMLTSAKAMRKLNSLDILYYISFDLAIISASPPEISTENLFCCIPR